MRPEKVKVLPQNNQKRRPRVVNPGESREESKEDLKEKERKERRMLLKETEMELEHVLIQNVLQQPDFGQTPFPVIVSHWTVGQMCG